MRPSLLAGDSSMWLIAAPAAVALRPGEKLYEDLLSDSESPLPSLHHKILRLKATPTNPSEVLASPWP